MYVCNDFPCFATFGGFCFLDRPTTIGWHSISHFQCGTQQQKSTPKRHPSTGVTVSTQRISYHHHLHLTPTGSPTRQRSLLRAQLVYEQRIAKPVSQLRSIKKPAHETRLSGVFPSGLEWISSLPHRKRSEPSGNLPQGANWPRAVGLDRWERRRPSQLESRSLARRVFMTCTVSVV